MFSFDAPACLFRLLSSLGVCCELRVARAASCFFILLYSTTASCLWGSTRLSTFCELGRTLLTAYRTWEKRESLDHFYTNGGIGWQRFDSAIKASELLCGRLYRWYRNQWLVIGGIELEGGVIGFRFVLTWGVS